MRASEFCNIMNEAIALDPNVLNLFNVMVPCAPAIGRLTPIELMSVDKNTAMANTLGVVNAMFKDERVVLSMTASQKPIFKVQVLSDVVGNSED